MVKVCKFGGSSAAAKNGYEKIKEIVFTDKNRKYIVVSAPGKRFDGDTKVTDLLLEAYSKKETAEEYLPSAKKIINRFAEISSFVGARAYEIQKEIERFFLTDYRESDADYFVSRGEYFSAKLVAAYLNCDFVDAKDLLIFDYNGKFNLTDTKIRCEKLLNGDKTVVIPGFYGGYPNGKVNLLGRGASDYSAACLATAVHAGMYENFTDVNGVLSADPKSVQNPATIPFLTFSELQRFSFSGAKVLEERTLEPLIGLNIPVTVKNTFNPYIGGTIISEERTDFSEKPLGIAGKRGLIAFNIAVKTCSDQVKTIRGISSFLAEKGEKTETFFYENKLAYFICEEEKLHSGRQTLQNGLSVLYGVEKVNVAEICKITIIGESGSDKNSPTELKAHGIISFLPAVTKKLETNGITVLRSNYSLWENYAEIYLEGDTCGKAEDLAYGILFGK